MLFFSSSLTCCFTYWIYHQAQAFAKVWASAGPEVVAQLKDSAFFSKRVSAALWGNGQGPAIFKSSPETLTICRLLAVRFPKPDLQLQQINWQVNVRLADDVHTRAAKPTALLELDVAEGKQVSASHHAGTLLQPRSLSLFFPPGHLTVILC